MVHRRCDEPRGFGRLSVGISAGCAFTGSAGIPAHRVGAAVKVSWQVTGIRQDAYANAHRIPVEQEKPVADRGKYLHPELFGASEDARVGHESNSLPASAVSANYGYSTARRQNRSGRSPNPRGSGNQLDKLHRHQMRKTPTSLLLIVTLYLRQATVSSAAELLALDE